MLREGEGNCDKGKGKLFSLLTSLLVTFSPPRRPLIVIFLISFLISRCRLPSTERAPRNNTWDTGRAARETMKHENYASTFFPPPCFKVMKNNRKESPCHSKIQPCTIYFVKTLAILYKGMIYVRWVGFFFECFLSNVEEGTQMRLDNRISSSRVKMNFAKLLLKNIHASVDTSLKAVRNNFFFFFLTNCIHVSIIGGDQCDRVCHWLTSRWILSAYCLDIIHRVWINLSPRARSCSWYTCLSLATTGSHCAMDWRGFA